MTYASDQIYEYLENKKDIPIDLYLDENVSQTELHSIRSEIDGALWFISLLSRLDGLVLMNKNLVVRGFGVEIKSDSLPEKIYSCSRQIPDELYLKEVDYNHFGTRHRSMMRYCWNYPGTVGFVVSQDGDVRAMTKCNNKLLIWDNIKLQAYTFVKPILINRRKPGI
jgi:DNA integrity scanning protein DisA with diadenylate cyclase activity